MVGLLVPTIAALLVLSAALGAEADAKKKKKKFNVVTCNTTETFCSGTDGKDRLVGTDIRDTIFGEGGNDVYQGNGGNDVLIDFSPTSSDSYTGYAASVTGFGTDSINDGGGSSDFLDFGTLRLADDISLVRQGDTDGSDNLFLDGPGGNDVRIQDHFGQGRIEKIKFANGTVTGTQAQDLAREATEEEHAAIEERLTENEHSNQEVKD